MNEAGRFEMLVELYAPLTQDEETGEMYREPGLGVISYDQFMLLLDADAGGA